MVGLSLFACKGCMKLTNRQQLYKKNRILGMTQINAARAAGYSEKYARQACRIENIIKVSLQDAFERAGLTDKKIVEFALSGMVANKVVSANITYGEADSKTNDFIEVPDWMVRHKFLETILKMTDRLREKVEHSGKVDITERMVVVLPEQQIPDQYKPLTNRIAQEVNDVTAE